MLSVVTVTFSIQRGCATQHFYHVYVGFGCKSITQKQQTQQENHAATLTFP